MLLTMGQVVTKVYSHDFKKTTDGEKTLSIVVTPTARHVNARKLLYFDRLLATVRDVEGDIVECGVGKGETLSYISTVVVEYCPERNVWGFDSFAGFPKPTSEDASSRKTKAGEWGEEEFGQSPLQTLLNAYQLYGLPVNWLHTHLTMVQGFFKDSLKQYTGGKIALLHLDVDLYGSYKTCLEQLYSKVEIGGIIAVDEYANTMELENFPGARKAIDEFMTDKYVEQFRDKYNGKYFFVRTK